MEAAGAECRRDGHLWDGQHQSLGRWRSAAGAHSLCGVLVESVLPAGCSADAGPLFCGGGRPAGCGWNGGVDAQPLDAALCGRQGNPGQDDSARCAALYRRWRAAGVVQLSRFADATVGGNLPRKGSGADAAGRQSQFPGGGTAQAWRNDRAGAERGGYGREARAYGQPDESIRRECGQRTHAAGWAGARREDAALHPARCH